MLERVWRKGNPLTLLVGMQTSAATMENSVERSNAVKEQYCIGTWNVRYVNQDKLEVVKQEMARVNVDILGISNLKWTGMGTFNYFSILALRTP